MVAVRAVPRSPRRGLTRPSLVDLPPVAGRFAHQDTLVLPYGLADQSISIATLSISQLLATMNPAS